MHFQGPKSMQYIWFYRISFISSDICYKAEYMLHGISIGAEFTLISFHRFHLISIVRASCMTAPFCRLVRLLLLSNPSGLSNSILSCEFVASSASLIAILSSFSCNICWVSLHLECYLFSIFLSEVIIVPSSSYIHWTPSLLSFRKFFNVLCYITISHSILIYYFSPVSIFHITLNRYCVWAFSKFFF